MPDDLDWIVSTARKQDPSLDHEIATELAAEALPLAQAAAGLDAPTIARELLSAHPSYGASSANAVAVATVDFLQQGSIEP
jgi:hypothetical protein